jgi:dienelactone hydrolase
MSVISQMVSVPADRVTLAGEFVVPASSRATAVLAHGLHASSQDPHVRSVADELHKAGFGTLAVDLFSETEGRRIERIEGQPVDLAMLGRRLVAAVDWVTIQPDARGLPLILCGSGAEAAVALLAAADLPERVCAVVSCDGQPALAGDALERVRVPVLFVVDDREPQSLVAHQAAARRLAGPHAVREVPGLTRRFAEPGVLQRTVDVIRQWCDELLRNG